MPKLSSRSSAIYRLPQIGASLTRNGNSGGYMRTAWESLGAMRKRSSGIDERPIRATATLKFSLGVMYDKGKGVERDQAEALHWMQKAADQRNVAGQYNLGMMYLKGEGTSQDYSRAMLWLGTAAQQGDADAQDALGDMFLFGEGVAEDDAEAIKWYRKAADKALVHYWDTDIRHPGRSVNVQG